MKKNGSKKKERIRSSKQEVDEENVVGVQERKKKNQTYTVEDLLSKAEECMETLQPELAEKFYLKALELDPNNSKVMDDLAFLLLDMDDFERAKKLLETSMKIAPDDNFAKYMHMGQLLEGKDSIQYFNKGIQLMIQEKEKQRDKEYIQYLKSQIATALCSVAEIYLTDACFEENAEQECQKLLDESLKYDNMNPETFQTFANLRISQERPEDALKLLTQGYSLLKGVVEFEDRPSYEFRHSTAKLFLELEQHRTAAEVWEELLEEDDNIAEVHYYLGLAYRQFEKSSALECLEKAKQLLTLSGCNDPTLSHNIDEIVNELQQSLAEQPEIEEDEDEELEGQEDEEMDTK